MKNKAMETSRVAVRTLLVFFFSIVVFSACSVVAESPIGTFKECVAAGNKVLRSYPARCVSKDGLTFVEDTAVQKLPLLQPEKSESFCKDTCGNDSCEMIVCMAQGCPCAESHENCPQDCSK